MFKGVLSWHIKKGEKSKKLKKMKKSIDFIFCHDNIELPKSNPWGIGSVGRAPALHAGCQEFESPILQIKHREHQFPMFYFVKI